MSDVIIPQESSATAHVVFTDQFGNVIQGAVFDTGTESQWVLDDTNIATLTVVDNETAVVSTITAGQTYLRVTGSYQGQTLTDVAQVTIEAQGGGYRISIEWDQPVPPV